MKEIEFRQKIADIIKEHLQPNAHKAYLKWKRKNVSYRGIQDRSKEDNGGMAKYGSGLYTAALSNKSMAKQYGQVYFVVHAVPKNPKIVRNTNDAEMFIQNLEGEYCAKHNKPRDPRYFHANTTIPKEMIAKGYDGLVIQGREMVNYTPPSNVQYFRSEEDVKDYFLSLYYGQDATDL